MTYRMKQSLSACFVAGAAIAMLLLSASVNSSQRVWRFDPDVPRAIELSPPVAKALGELAYRASHWPYEFSDEEWKAYREEGKALIAPLNASPEVTVEEKITLLVWAGRGSATTEREWYQWLFEETQKAALEPEWQFAALRLLEGNLAKLVPRWLKGTEYTSAYLQLCKKLWPMFSQLAREEPDEGICQLAAIASALPGMMYFDDPRTELSPDEVDELYPSLMAQVEAYNKAAHNRPLVGPPYLYFMGNPEELPTGACFLYGMTWSWHTKRSTDWLTEQAVSRRDLPALKALAKMQEKILASDAPDLVRLIVAGNGLSRILTDTASQLISPGRSAQTEKLAQDLMEPVLIYSKTESQRYGWSLLWYTLTFRSRPAPDTRTLALKHADSMKKVQAEMLVVAEEAVQFVEELTPEDFTYAVGAKEEE